MRPHVLLNKGLTQPSCGTLGHNHNLQAATLLSAAGLTANNTTESFSLGSMWLFLSSTVILLWISMSRQEALSVSVLSCSCYRAFGRLIRQKLISDWVTAGHSTCEPSKWAVFPPDSLCDLMTAYQTCHLQKIHIAQEELSLSQSSWTFKTSDEFCQKTYRVLSKLRVTPAVGKW